MKLKYGISVLLVVLCVCLAGYLCIAAAPDVSVTAEPETEVTALDFAILDGKVISLENDRMILNSNGQEYAVLLTVDTVYEGKSILEIGDVVSVQYNGQMTKSDPAQLTAQSVFCHVVTGVVSDLAENQFVLTLPDESVYLVNYDVEAFEGVQDGMTVSVYFDGASTRSIPPQIAADFIRMPAISGVISALNESEFTLTDEGGIETIVHISKKTFSYMPLEEGMQVRVTTDGTATLSLPAQVNAVEILP